MQNKTIQIVIGCIKGSKKNLTSVFDEKSSLDVTSEGACLAFDRTHIIR